MVLSTKVTQITSLINLLLSIILYKGLLSLRHLEPMVKLRELSELLWKCGMISMNLNLIKIEKEN